LTENCDLDICSQIENKAACDDEAGNNDEDESSLVSKRSYTTQDGRTLWSYDNNEDNAVEEEWNHLDSRALPGGSRVKLIQLRSLLGPLYEGKSILLSSRPYWPGLKSLKGDGSETLTLKGGFSLLKDTCSSTAVKFIPQGSLPKIGFQAEHMREINMFDKFLNSLLTGVKYSGEAMTNKFDPNAIAAGWNKLYPASLPRIGSIVKDAKDYTIPLTFNDRIYEIIGSYAYRTGLSFVPGTLNLYKKVALNSQSPLGPPAKFIALLNQVALNGDTVSMVKILTAMQNVCYFLLPPVIISYFLRYQPILT
jgi:chitinase